MLPSCSGTYPPHSLLPAGLSACLLMAPFQAAPRRGAEVRAGPAGQEGGKVPQEHMRVSEVRVPC